MIADQRDIKIPAIANSSAEKWSLISLTFSLFYFFGLYAGWQHYQATQVVLVFICYGLFLACYFHSLRRSGADAMLPIAGIILVATITATFHAGANALFGYAAFLASYYFTPNTARLFLISNLIAQLSVAVLFDMVHVYFLGPSIAVTVSLHFYGLFSQKECIFQVAEAERSSQIEQLAAIAERERIARDMHDLLGHSLSSLALKAELADKLISKGRVEQAQQEISEVAEISRNTLSEVRAAVTGLKQKGIKPILTKLCEQLEHLGFKTNASFDLPDLDAKTESTLIMLCKEWITNILRHSKGDEVHIEVRTVGSRIHLDISDNGKVKKLKAGNGIEGMKSRISELKGEFALSTEHGVKLAVVLPFSQ